MRAISRSKLLYDIYLLTVIQYFGLQKIPKKLLQNFELFVLKYSSNNQANASNQMHFLNHYNPDSVLLNAAYGIS